VSLPVGASSRRRGGLERAFSLGIAIAAVPVFSGRHWWVSLVIVLVACFAAGKWQDAAVLVAYWIPSVTSAPWPIHCFTALAASALVNRSLIDRSAACEGRSLGARGTGSMIVTGIASGLVVVLIDKYRIVDSGFLLPWARPSGAVLLLAVTFLAATNATGEEFVWRVYLRDHSSRLTVGNSYVLQSISFGLAHWNGIPSGFAGVAASSVFSAMCLSASRRYGFKGALVLHFAADVVIFGAVALHASFVGFYFGR